MECIYGACTQAHMHNKDRRYAEVLERRGVDSVAKASRLQRGHVL